MHLDLYQYLSYAVQHKPLPVPELLVFQHPLDSQDQQPLLMPVYKQHPEWHSHKK